jgi:hypothetical protein
MPHWPKEEEGMAKSTRARRRKLETAKTDLQPPLVILWRTGCPSRGGIRRVCGEPPGRTRRELSRRGTGRPKLGNGRACTMEAKAVWFLPSVPRCVRATWWGRETDDPGRPGSVRREGRVAMVWHSQTKGRATEKTNGDLQPPKVRGDISGSEILAEALPGVGAGYSTQERRQNKRRRRVATCNHAGRLKRSSRRGRPRA